MKETAEIFRALASWVVAGCLVVLTLTAVFVAVVLMDRREGPAADIAGMAEEVTDLFADSLTEAGFGFSDESLDDPLLAGRRILITEGINERVANAVVRRLFYLDATDPTAPIDLYIATAGGWLDSAFTIVDAMEGIRAPVNTIAIGGCYSAGSVILVSGTGRRVATPNVVISVHANQTAGDRKYSAWKPFRERFERVYREKASVPEEWFPMTGEKHYYLSPEEALELGLVDEVRARGSGPRETLERGGPGGRGVGEGEPVSLVAEIAVGIVAALHLGFLVLEMFLWTRPVGRRIFRTRP